MLAFAVLIETAISMVLLSRVLPYPANRLANVSVGALQTASVVFSLFGATPTVFYRFFAAIEIACTLFIVWYAWTWPDPQRAEGVTRQDGTGGRTAHGAGVGFENEGRP